MKLFCVTCGRVEAFNSVSTADVLRRVTHERPYQLPGGTVQNFVLSYLCQSCKSVPEVFLIRRCGVKLTIAGRSPIEHVDLPKVIPKVIQGFVRAAVVAHQSGQTLAGVFLLRTAVEQWSRVAVGDANLQADETLDKYMDMLPPDFNVRFPSLRALYADLSADMHSATGSTDLFDRACSEIVTHFEARRLFKL